MSNGLSENGLLDAAYRRELPATECLNYGDDCRGAVEYRSTDMIKWWPRCQVHFEERLANQAHINELTSPMHASWFDESYAGERWDDDY